MYYTAYSCIKLTVLCIIAFLMCPYGTLASHLNGAGGCTCSVCCERLQMVPCGNSGRVVSKVVPYHLMQGIWISIPPHTFLL